jgi:hypothetical protein
MQLVGLEASRFPLLYITVKAFSNGVPVGSHQVTNFLAYEEGRLQTDFFDVTLPGAERTADVVFLIDTSGSMGDDIVNVRNAASAFADALSASGIDYRLALVRFGQSANSGAASIAMSLSTDVNLFKSILSGWTAGGGTEPGFAAIRLAIQQLPFRPGAQKVFILITDEDSDDRDKANTISLILANSVTVHAVVLCTDGTSQTDYCDATSVRGVSGGLLFDIAATTNYTPILTNIVARIANTYTIRYRTDNPVADGRERCGLIVVTNDVCGADVQFCYTPGGGPVIIRTLQTLALHRQPLLQGSTPQICVQVLDSAAPYVTNVTLYARTSGTGAFTQLRMIPAPGGDPSNNVYCASVPSGLVQPPGVDYYVRATDGQVTASAPSTDPETMPYQLAVLPNVAPDIVHVPPICGPLGVDLPLTVQCADTTMSVASLAVFYRLQGQLLYRTNLMVYTAQLPTNVTETFVIPAAWLVPPVLEYYVKAVDNTGISSVWPEGGADQPYQLPICDANRCPVAICQSITVSNDLGQCLALVMPNQLDGGSYDPDGDPLTYALTPSPPYPVGTTLVTLTVTDPSLCSSNCEAMITVVDAEAPLITCPADIVQANDAGQCSATVGYLVTASDNCSLASLVCEPLSGSVFPKGATTVNCTATDAAGNVSLCSFTVTVEDREAPRVAARPAPNPSAKKIPVAGKNPDSGQNPDGYYQLLAEDNCDAAPKIYVKDDASPFIAGPFANGDIVKIIQAGNTSSKPGTPPIVAQIHLLGDALVYAVDADGNVSPSVYCKVPPPPK